MRNSIQSRTLAALLLAVLVTAALSASLSYRSAKQILAQESLRTLRVTSDSKKEELLLTLKRQEDRALAFLENNLIDCLEVRDVRCVRVNLDNFRAAEQATGAVVRLHGSRKISVGDAAGLMEGPDHSSILFEPARGSQHSYLLYAHSDKTSADIAMRLPSAQIDAVFRPRSANLGDGGDVFVVDQTGALFTTDGGHHSPPQSQALGQCLRGRDGETTERDSTGRRVVTSYRYLRELGGGCVIAYIDEATMLLPARKLRYEMIGLAIPMVLIAAAFAFFLSQRVTRPIQLLTERVRKLQRGDFDSTISIRGPAEIQTFAETFANMVTSLKRSREQQRAADEKLRQSEKLAAAGRLAATIAHEVNNPLGAAMNSLFLLRDKVTSEGRELLQGADEQLRRVAGITRQTLGFYRENASRINFNLGDVVDELITTLMPKARNKNVVIESEVGPLEVFAVKGEIQQVIANLLTNAIDATPESSKIRVRSRRIHREVADSVQISVGDCGPGIPPDLQERVWEPFFTTKQDVGTGLGLWVCKQIIERHNGTIRLHSTPQGTVFTIVLPQRNHVSNSEAAS
jgi:signal transduction histidine kinase